jgi:peptidoglycan/LPS O-acetylase OafA/YrhL
MAAAIVFTEHVGFAAGVPDWLGYTPLGLLMAGFESVILFFALSGFVLALPYTTGEQAPHARFLTRRFLRLWPAYAVAILVAALVKGVPAGSAGILMVSSAGLLVAGSHLVTALNTPFWSLIHEARASIAFPLLVRVSRSSVGCVLVALAWLAECLWPAKLPGALAVTVLTLPAFVAGIRLALRPPSANPLLSPRMLVVIALGCAFATNAISNHRAWTIPVDILAAVLLITAARQAPAFLLSRIPQYLGRISYSLYLIHLPLFYVVRHEPALLPAAGVLAVVLADLSQRFIEAPAIRFGRRLPEPVPASALAAPLAK